MANASENFDLDDVVAQVIGALDGHNSISVFSSTYPVFELSDAYRVTAKLRSVFEARGETVTGRKIGFTNREMWQAHGVAAPIWGYCTDRTTTELDNVRSVSVSDFTEARIEPEIIFGLGQAPCPSMNTAELFDCIEWLSLGFEVVQSIYPGWRFAAADTVAANALHGTLLVGRRHLVVPRKDEWQRELANFRIELYCDGKLSQSGGGMFVLGSPLNALRHLVKLLEEDPHNPQLKAGEMVSTGTLTLAMPVNAGEHWTTRVYGTPLDEIDLRFGG